MCCFKRHSTRDNLQQLLQFRMMAANVFDLKKFQLFFCLLRICRTSSDILSISILRDSSLLYPRSCVHEYRIRKTSPAGKASINAELHPWQTAGRKPARSQCGREAVPHACDRELLMDTARLAPMHLGKHSRCSAIISARLSSSPGGTVQCFLTGLRSMRSLALE